MRLLVKNFIGFFLLLLSTAVFAKRSFIIDTDVAPDDQVAILYMLKRSDIDVKAITIANTGEAHCGPAMQNVFALLKLTHYHAIPVACGRDEPLAGSHHFPDWLRKEADEVSSSKKILIKHDQAADVLIKQLQSLPRAIDILAIAPLTNIAEALKKQPQIKNKIHQIYLMGGAINVEGNVNITEKSINNKVAEWNLYIDPTAAHVVLSSGAPITLIPLDVTNQMPIDTKFYHLLSTYQNNPGVNYLYELYHRKEAEIFNHKWYFWDAVASVIANDESIASMKTKKIRIVLSPESESGATVVDNQNGINVRVCFAMDKPKFENILLKTIAS